MGQCCCARPVTLAEMRASLDEINSDISHNIDDENITKYQADANENATKCMENQSALTNLQAQILILQDFILHLDTKYPVNKQKDIMDYISNEIVVRYYTLKDEEFSEIVNMISYLFRKLKDSAC